MMVSELLGGTMARLAPLGSAYGRTARCSILRKAVCELMALMIVLTMNKCVCIINLHDYIRSQIMYV